MWSSSTPFPVVISAASGTGKTTVVSRLTQAHPELFHVSVSATTRARRGHEVDGVHYHFMSADEFMALVDQGKLLEWARVYGHYYGTPRAEVEGAYEKGKIPLLDIDVQGGMQVMSAVPGTVSVFLLAPSMSDLHARLRTRGTDAESAVAGRLQEAPGEIEQGLATYDYVVINDDLTRCVDTVWAIVTAERARAWRIRDACDSPGGG